jgi:hypothetical protein
MNNNQSIIMLEKIDLEVNPFQYLNKSLSSDIVFGKKIDSYQVIKLPGAARKKIIRDYESGFCIHVYDYDNLIVAMIEVVLQDDSGKYKPYCGKLPFNLKSEMLRKEVNESLGKPQHISDEKMTYFTVDNKSFDSYFCHDIYKFSDGHLTLRYNYYSKHIERIIVSKSG